MPLPKEWGRSLPENTTDSVVRTERFVAAREGEGIVVYPPAPLRYRALELVAPEKVRVVILGQDPYHGAGQAMGLSFSVPQGARVPPSLRNIYKELKADLGIDPRAHGDLTGWARQGVLLLNTALTVEAGNAGSHAKIGWETLTDSLIALASSAAPAAAFLLWGNYARAKAPLIDRSRHLVLEAAHPSPLSARKYHGCRHFSRSNAFLFAHGAIPVQWELAQE